MRLLVLIFALLATPALALQPPPPPEQAIGETLDQLHAAAARADGARYFALYSKSAIYIGTDAAERWTLAEFKAFAEPYFARARAGPTGRASATSSSPTTPAAASPGSTNSSTAKATGPAGGPASWCWRTAGGRSPSTP